jgi:hypothetical protein
MPALGGLKLVDSNIDNGLSYWKNDASFPSPQPSDRWMDARPEWPHRIDPYRLCVLQDQPAVQA